MSAAPLHTALYDWLKPFLEKVKTKGFNVSPDTHIQIFGVLLHSADQMKDEQVLFDYISPLLAKSREDVLLLKAEWDKYCEREAITPIPQPDDIKNTNNLFYRTKNAVQKHSYLTGLGLIVCMALCIVIWKFLYVSNIPLQASYEINAVNVKQPVNFNASKTFTKNSDTAGVQFIWNFGDGITDSASGMVAQHTYNKPGDYSTSLTLIPRISKIQITKAKAEHTLTICKPDFIIVQQPEGELTPGQQASFSVVYDSLYPASGGNVWQLNGKAIEHNKTTITLRFDSAGAQTVTYIDSNYNSSKSCGVSFNTIVTIKPPDTVTINVNQTGATIAPPVNVNSIFLWVMGALYTFCVLAYIFISIKLAKQTGDNQQTASEILAQLKGKSAPYEIPYKNREEVIDDEPLIPVLAKQFKRRIADENVYLNIPLTIAAAIKSEGFLLPVFTSKTTPAEYLILIDKQHVKSGQVKLFEFLIKRFCKSDIYIEQFYFTDKPTRCFNDYYPKGIYTARLYDLYPNHRVIIFGNGHQFLDRYYPAVNETAVLPFLKWNQCAIFTPVPFSDWTNKENLLQQSFLLLPADLEGQLLFFEFIDNPELNKSECLKQQKSIYKTKGINFNNAAKIERYLNDNFLFQWLCAAAINPSIHWQVLLGIGDALQKERYYGSNIQYSSLLKIMRIPWMRDAAFPEETRLELLKKLEPENERIARKAMIQLAEEALEKINNTSFIYEELFMQQMTDKFLLYAHNPADPEFKDYKEDYERFKALWKDGKIRDTVLKDYLKKEEDGDWSTLIGNPELSNKPSSSIGIDEIFTDKPSAASKILRWCKYAALVIFCCSLLLTGLVFVFKNEISNTSIGQRLNLTVVDENATVPFTFSIAFNQCFNAAQMQRDKTVFSLYANGEKLLTLDGKDSLAKAAIPYTALKNPIQLQVTSNNAQYNFDSSFKLNTNALSIGITGCSIFCNEWTKMDSTYLPSTFAGDWYNSSIVNGTDELYTPVHIQSHSINNEETDEILTCSLNPLLRRVVTSNEGGTYSVYYLLQTNTKQQIGFAKNVVSYYSMTNAEQDTTRPNLMDMVSPVPAGSSFTNSNTFYNTLDGSWQNIDSSYTFKVQNAQDQIVINASGNYLLAKEEVRRTEFGKQLYKLLFQAPSPDEPVKYSKIIYILVLDSSRILLSEVAASNKVNSNNSSPGTFRLLRRQTASGEVPAQLPQSLNEIWHGGTNNRLININLSKDVLYYSVNDTKTYGTYSIDEVYLTKSGAYKIITKTNQGYKLFFIRNIRQQSFELSVCQNFVAAKAELQNKDESYCGQFNTMTLYYPVNSSVIYLPVYGNTLVASEKRKMDSKSDSINSLYSSSYSQTGDAYAYDIALFSSEGYINSISKIMINNFLDNSKIDYSVGRGGWVINLEQHAVTDANPFARNYLIININKPVPPVPDCSRTFTSIDEVQKLGNPLIVCKLDLSKANLTALPTEIFSYANVTELNLGTTVIPQTDIDALQKVLPKCKITYNRSTRAYPDTKTGGETALGTIQVDDKSGEPNQQGMQLIAAISEQLRKDTASKIRLGASYENGSQYKTIQSYISNIINLFRKNGLSQYAVSKQIQQSIQPTGKAQQQMQQQQKAPSKSLSYNTAAISIDVIGINFPAGFKVNTAGAKSSGY